MMHDGSQAVKISGSVSLCMANPLYLGYSKWDYSFPSSACPFLGVLHHMTIMTIIVTCVGRSKAPPVPLLPLLYEVCGMANIERSITKLLNDDVNLALAHPVMAS